MTKLQAARFFVLFLAFTVIGCSPGQDPNTDRDADSGDAHTSHDGHDHEAHAGHDHAALGPNEGHVVVLGDEEYHIEWLHDDDAGTVTAILLDGEMKEEVSTTADVVTVEVTIGDAEPRKYELPAVNRSDDQSPRASRFELTEPALITALKLGEGVKVVLHVEVDGKTYSAPVEHEADYGHNH
jgi:hypothetical protein